MNEREIFLAAIQIGDAQERNLFLDSICQPGDVRKRINKLLKAHFRPKVELDRVAEYIAQQTLETGSEPAGGIDQNAHLDRQSHALLRKALGDLFNPPAHGLARPGNEASVPPGTKLNRYQVIKRIGYGGMAEVYLARDTQLDRNIAIKLLAPSRTNDPIWLQQFRREARSAGGLNHPNILTIHEIGEAGGVHFLATEFVDGVTLRQKLAAGLPSVSDAIDYAIQIASALVAAHTANIIHRDLKPENVMVRADGLLKVLDFGLAKQVAMHALPLQESDPSRYLSNPGIVIGTVTYMSPEQARGRELDPRTDIFSLGIVLYELLTGTSPFPGETATDVLVSILEHEPRPVGELSEGIPEELETIVSKCLSKDRDKRFKSALELLTELKRGFRLKASELNTVSRSPNPPIRPRPASENDEIPTVRYARSGDVNIAYQVVGDGAIDLVFVMGWVSHLEMFWKQPSFARFLRRLATFSRLILFDKRGTGLSDKVPIDQLPTLEQRMDDVRAVMDAAGSKRAVLCGVSEGGPMCTLFAATYPEKTIALTMIGCYARRLWATDYPWGPTDEHRQHFFDEMRRDWGGPVGIDDRAPSAAQDPEFRNWWATYLRMGASPGAALALTQMNAQINIRPILASVQVPTLVIHRTDDRCLLVEEGRFLAGKIPGAKFVELPGNDHLPFVGDQDAILDEIEEFLTGVRHATHVDRVLATVLFIHCDAGLDLPTDGLSASKQERIFHSHVVREVALFHGRNVSFRNNGVVVSFDGPVRAIRAAIAILDTASRLGVKLKTGVHTGECEMDDQHVFGPAVESAEQVAQLAVWNEVLVSNTVKDLVVGSGLKFQHSTTIELPIQTGELSLFRVCK